VPDEDALELLRQRSGLSIDLEGRLCHQGEPITHRRTLEVLWGSLSRAPDGRYTVRVGREMGYVLVEDAPYGVRGVTFHEGDAGAAGDAADAGWPTAHLTDGTREKLDPSTLSLDGAGILHCRVKAGLHRARFTRTAQVQLGLALEEVAGGAGQLALRLGDRTYPIAGP
jgi:hypothetical protein